MATKPARHSARTYLLLLTFIALRAFGNLLLAWGTKHFPEILGINPLGYLRAMLNPYIALGIVLLMVSLLTRLAIFSVADLSFVLPITSVGYIVSVLFGHLFLGEQITPARWVGVCLIFTATFLVGSTPQNTTPASATEANSS